MNATLRIRKIGHSLGVILPEDVLGYFNAKEGDTFLPTSGTDKSGRLMIADEGTIRQMAIVEDLDRRYHNTLKELAKGPDGTS
ncbi:transcriptional regulator [Opitutaceae bacterium TAV5]|nr:transcriptional regulator [Opitutaceae bacterium TAV5]